MRISDWSSDVCSSDLEESGVLAAIQLAEDRLVHARKRSVDLRRNRALRLIPKAPLLGTKEGDAVIPMQRVDQGHGFAQGPMGHGGRLRRRGKDFGEHLPRSEEHTSELQSLMRISYAVFSLQKQTSQHTS